MAKRTVLVVEDDNDLQLFVREVLRSEGFKVLGASNGIEALEQVAEAKPDIILLDMRLPRMDGWEFARELHAREDYKIPIVVMTALNARHVAEQIQAEEYLQKPFDIDELLRVVESADGAAK